MYCRVVYQSNEYVARLLKERGTRWQMRCRRKQSARGAVACLARSVLEKVRFDRQMRRSHSCRDRNVVEPRCKVYLPQQVCVRRKTSMPRGSRERQKQDSRLVKAPAALWREASEPMTDGLLGKVVDLRLSLGIHSYNSLDVSRIRGLSSVAGRALCRVR